jgi:hypothetical protein
MCSWGKSHIKEFSTWQPLATIVRLITATMKLMRSVSAPTLQLETDVSRRLCGRC